MADDAQRGGETWFRRDGWWWVNVPDSTGGPFKICEVGQRPTDSESERKTLLRRWLKRGV